MFRPMGEVDEDIAVDARSFTWVHFPGRSDQSPLPREAVLPRRYTAKLDPTTRYTLRCNTESVMKM